MTDPLVSALRISGTRLVNPGGDGNVAAASAINYSNATSGIPSSNVQGAIDEVAQAALLNASGINFLQSGSRVVRENSDASYQLVLADMGSTLVMDRNGAQTLTLPDNATVATSEGTSLLVHNYQSGNVTLVAGGLSTLEVASDKLGIIPPGGSVWIFKIASNEWCAFGDLNRQITSCELIISGSFAADANITIAQNSVNGTWGAVASNAQPVPKAGKYKLTGYAMLTRTDSSANPGVVSAYAAVNGSSAGVIWYGVRYSSITSNPILVTGADKILTLNAGDTVSIRAVTPGAIINQSILSLEYLGP